MFTQTFHWINGHDNLPQRDGYSTSALGLLSSVKHKSLGLHVCGQYMSERHSLRLFHLNISTGAELWAEFTWFIPFLYLPVHLLMPLPHIFRTLHHICKQELNTQNLVTRNSLLRKLFFVMGTQIRVTELIVRNSNWLTHELSWICYSVRLFSTACSISACPMETEVWAF